MRHYKTFIVIISLFVLVVAALLLSDSESAEAGGTGSWPYPGAGNWEVLFDTEVWDETITVDGDVMVHSVGSLILDNVTIKVQGAGGINILGPGWMFIQNESDLSCDVISGQDSAVCRIWDTNLTPYTTTVELRFWEPGHWVDINQSSAQFVWGQFQSSAEIQFRNSTFPIPPTGVSGAYFKLYTCANVNITNSQFTNFTADTLFFIVDEDANITDNTFLSCDAIHSRINGTVTYTGNAINHFITVEVVDAFLQPVAGARVVVFDTFDVTVSDRTANSSGLVEWIVCEEIDGVTEQTPHLIVVSRQGNFAEVQVRIVESMTIQVRLREYEQQIQVVFQMRNNWTKGPIPFGQLHPYLNLPTLTQDDDYLIVSATENFIYYPTSCINITIFDWFERLIWYSNQSVDYLSVKEIVVATINFTTIKIRQYDVDTDEELDVIPEFTIELTNGTGAITVDFEGDKFSVPEIEGGDNNYTVSWGEGTNYTAGTQEITVAARVYPKSTHADKTTGTMVADIGVKSKAKLMGTTEESWYMILKEPYVWVPLTIAAIIGGVITWQRILKDTLKKRKMKKAFRAKIRRVSG